jgi:hypothetical protein
LKTPHPISVKKPSCPFSCDSYLGDRKVKGFASFGRSACPFLFETSFGSCTSQDHGLKLNRSAFEIFSKRKNISHQQGPAGSFRRAKKNCINNKVSGILNLRFSSVKPFAGQPPFSFYYPRLAKINF